MLFSSLEFILLFLPLTAIAYQAANRFGGARHGRAVILLASIIYYAWWSIPYVLLPLLSGVVNFFIGKRLAETRSRSLLAAGVAMDVGLLGYFKYIGLFSHTVTQVFGVHMDFPIPLLPLAISFITFQKIAFLVDCYSGVVKPGRFSPFLLFVMFFPQLIAGPIVHYRELASQFQRLPRLLARNVAAGLSIFVVGLAKKVLIADTVATFSTPIFASADTGLAPDLLHAWQAALAYTIQIYFDFSGYTDMAIGAALIFGVRLPINFNSPYKSASIIEFWQRWHITLSRFLRDYLYIPLGGNRLGEPRRYINLIIVMLLGGLWHGANWTFLAWGGLHGAYLSIAHMWKTYRGRFSIGELPYVAAWLITMLAVIVAWVLFRATTFKSAILVLRGMVGLNGIELPLGFARYMSLDPVQDGFVRFVFGGWTAMALGWLYIVGAAAISLAFSNTQTLFRRWRPALYARPEQSLITLTWRPTLVWALAITVLAITSLFWLIHTSEFLYYQF